MNFEYEIKLDDYRQLYQLEKGKKLPRSRFILLSAYSLYCLFLFILIFIWEYEEIKHILSELFLAAVFYLIGFAVLWWVIKAIFNSSLGFKRQKKYYQNKPSLLGEREIFIFQKNIKIQAKSFQILLDWKVFDYFLENELIFVLYFHDKQCQVIPKRHFENAEEISNFRSVLINKGADLEAVLNDDFGLLREADKKQSIWQFNYQLDLSNYLDAERLEKEPKIWSSFFYVISFLIVIIFIGYDLWRIIEDPDLLAKDFNVTLTIFSDLLYLGFFFYYLPIIFPNLNIFQRKKKIKNFQNYPEMNAKIDLLITEEGLILLTNYCQQKNGWEEYLNFLENERIFLLYYSQAYYHIIPKTAFSSQENLKKFRELMPIKINN